MQGRSSCCMGIGGGAALSRCAKHEMSAILVDAEKSGGFWWCAFLCGERASTGAERRVD